MSGGEMKKREKHPSQWREILSAGVDGWSSFSDTCSDEPNENFAKEGTTTTATNDNGASEQVQQQIHHHHQKEKSYPSLDLHWKQERRDIEWQCLWLELRLKELQSHKKRYERKLKLLDENAAGDKERVSKPKSKNGKMAKMVVFNDHPLFDPIRRRREKILKKRKSALMSGEEDGDADAKMTDADEDGKASKKAKIEDDASKEEHKGNKSGSGGDSDVSNTVMHEKCEDLKKRCLGLMQRLGQPPPIFTSNQGGGGGGAKGGRSGGSGGGGARGSRNGRNRNKNNPYGGGGAAGGGNAVGGGSGNNDANNNNNNNADANNNARKHMSRKSDEYDINNVVGDVIGAKYVERALHEDINTPSVRVVTTFTMSVEELRRLNNTDKSAANADAKNEDGDDSSDEDISDEAFATRHAKYEVMEKNARMPLELLKKAEREKNGGKSPRGRKAKPSSASKSNSGSEDEKQAVKRTADLNAINATAPVVLSKKGAAPRASESNSDSPSDGSAELNEDMVRELLRA
jgi:hypothetical protein